MAYTPSGFWSRLITRLIVSVQRWRAIEQIKEESYSLVYWREGIGVVYEGGYFQVESYQELVGCAVVLCFSCCVTLIGGLLSSIPYFVMHSTNYKLTLTYSRRALQKLKIV